MSSRPSKKRKLTPPQSDDEGDSRGDSKIQSAFFKNAAKWDLLEDQYKARKGTKKEKVNNRLPVKRDGRIQAVATPVEDLQESDDDWLDGEGDGSGAEEEEAEEEKPEEPEIPVKEQIRNAKEELAKLASVLNEQPYENPGAFKALTKIGESKIPAIISLSLVTRMAIYKDVIPGYRIRPNMGEPGEKISKEIRNIRAFEQALVSGYQAYVKELAGYAKAKKGEAINASLASVAITCAASLLTTHPHFNFRAELINILVWKLSSRRPDKDFEKAISAIITLFNDDEEGRPSFEAVSTLCRMMKAKDYQVHESVINLFLHLRLLSEFSGKASNESVDLPMPESRKKQKRVFRTKRERKHLKEEKALQKDMDQASANVLHEERDRMQSECLKAVFTTYFRILKLRTPHLMGAVLEGLAKFAHLINQQFFGDLLEALKDLIRHSDADETSSPDGENPEDSDSDSPPTRNPTREALLCTATAFALLAGQDAHNAKADLHLDLSFFTTHLWQTLLPISQFADIELSARSLHLPDPDSPGRPDTRTNKVNLQTTTVLLIRCLTAVLLPPWNIRSTPPIRLAAFAKQLMTTAMHVPEKSAQALLALLADVGNTHGRKIAALWNTEERKGDGVFNALAQSEEGSNPFATTVWEGEILRRHYCPKVRDAVKMMEKNIMSDGR